RSRLVRAEWIARQGVAYACKGPRPGAAADLPVFASTAFPLELFRRVQCTKKRGVAIDINQMISANVTCLQRQKTGRINIALARDEYNAIAIADPETAIDRALSDLI